MSACSRLLIVGVVVILPRMARAGAGPTPVPTATGSVPACANAPMAGCRTPALVGKGRIRLQDKVPDSRDRLTWKWLKGSLTDKAEFGDPITPGGTGYSYCMYDGAGALIARGTAPADGACPGPRPCWKERKLGFRYSDKNRDPDGIVKLDLRAGVAEKARIILQGKGSNLTMPPLPISPLPLLVQMVNGNGVCWESSFSTSQKNEPERFKAKAD